MKQSFRNYLAFYSKSVLNSYGQIFFSLQTWFAVTLLILSLLDLRVGLGGLMAVILSNFIAHLLGFSQEKIKTGLYSFNAVFVGMALMNKFYLNNSFVIFFIFAVILVFMLTIWIETMFSKQKLPVLTLPFVFTMFVIDLAFKSFANIELIPSFDRFTVLLARQMNNPLYGIVHSLDNANIPPLFFYYFKTLASVFFTDSILVGILIAVGLLFHSRIKSTVAFLGFIGAYLSVKALGVDMQVLTQNLGGINYVFWGMAIGSFFIIPNIYSYLLVIGLTPALFLFYASIENLVGRIGLSSYTLSFSLLSILLRLGWLYYLSKNYESSIKYYQQATKIRPKAVEALLGLCNPLEAQKKTDQLEGIYKRILAIDPMNSKTNYALGNIYYYRKNFALAEKYYDVVVGMYPFDYYSNLMSGWTKYFLGKKNEAKQLFNTVLIIFPADTSAKEGLSLIK